MHGYGVLAIERLRDYVFAAQPARNYRLSSSPVSYLTSTRRGSFVLKHGS